MRTEAHCVAKMFFSNEEGFGSVGTEAICCNGVPIVFVGAEFLSEAEEVVAFVHTVASHFGSEYVVAYFLHLHTHIGCPAVAIHFTEHIEFACFHHFVHFAGDDELACFHIQFKGVGASRNLECHCGTRFRYFDFGAEQIAGDGEVVERHGAEAIFSNSIPTLVGCVGGSCKFGGEAEVVVACFIACGFHGSGIHFCF